MNFRKIISYFLLFSFIIVLLNDCRTLQNLFRKPKVCLVLSVGGDKGISHIGGIDALKERNIQIDCIFGNSMGSVIGSLYATAPNENLRERYGKFIAEYIKKTEKEIKGGFLTGFLIGLGAMLVTGGTLGWETMLGSLGAGAITSSFHEKFDNDRFKRVMNEYYKNITVDKTIIPFATEYQYLKGQGLEMHIATTENLAEAVSRSANNPFIFKGAKLTYIDLEVIGLQVSL